MNNQYVVGGSTPLRGGGGGGGAGGGGAQPDDVRLNLSSVGTAGVYGGPSRTGADQGVYYSTGLAGASSIGGVTTLRNDHDNRSIASTPSKISKFTYSGM